MFPSRSEYILCGPDGIYAADAVDGRALARHVVAVLASS